MIRLNASKPIIQMAILVCARYLRIVIKGECLFFQNLVLNYLIGLCFKFIQYLLKASFEYFITLLPLFLLVLVAPDYLQTWHIGKGQTAHILNVYFLKVRMCIELVKWQLFGLVLRGFLIQKPFWPCRPPNFKITANIKYCINTIYWLSYQRQFPCLLAALDLALSCLLKTRLIVTYCILWQYCWGKPFLWLYC